MKTILMMVEVTDERYNEIVEEIQMELDNPTDEEVKLTAYETYIEGDLIPDIMRRLENGSEVTCKHCGKTFIYDEFETDCCEGRPICADCFDKSYTYCEDCGKCVPYSDCIFADDDSKGKVNIVMCKDCYSKEV